MHRYELMNQNYESFRQDKSNYFWSVIYDCSDDPCVVLPMKKEWGLGWTINFGHRYAVPVLSLLGIIGLSPGICYLIALKASENLSQYTKATVVLTPLVVSFFICREICKKLSNKPC